MAEHGFRITYATMSADNEELHKAYDRGIEVARFWLGKRHPFYVNGEARQGSGTKEERSPIDHDLVIGEFAQATGEDVRDAVRRPRPSRRRGRRPRGRSGLPWSAGPPTSSPSGGASSRRSWPSKSGRIDWRPWATWRSRPTCSGGTATRWRSTTASPRRCSPWTRRVNTWTCFGPTACGPS